MFLCGQAQAARSGEIKRARIADNLPDHAGQVAAFEPLLQREQRVLRGLGLDMDQPVAQFLWQTVAVWSPAALDCAGILNPQDLTPIIDLGQRVLHIARHPRLCFQGIARQSQRQPRPARITGIRKNLAVQWLLGQARPPARLARLGQGSDVARRQTRSGDRGLQRRCAG